MMVVDRIRAAILLGSSDGSLLIARLTTLWDQTVDLNICESYIHWRQELVK